MAPPIVRKPLSPLQSHGVPSIVSEPLNDRAAAPLRTLALPLQLYNSASNSSPSYPSSSSPSSSEATPNHDGVALAVAQPLFIQSQPHLLASQLPNRPIPVHSPIPMEHGHACGSAGSSGVALLI